MKRENTTVLTKSKQSQDKYIKEALKGAEYTIKLEPKEGYYSEITIIKK